MKPVGNLRYRHIGRGEQVFDFLHNLPVYELLGRSPRDSGRYFRKVVGGDAELVGIEFHLVPRIAVLRHQFAEAVEKSARGRNGFEVLGRSIENQLDLYRKKQILQMVSEHHAGGFCGGALRVIVGKGVPCFPQCPLFPGGRQYRFVVDALEECRRQRQDYFIGEFGRQLDHAHTEITARLVDNEQRIGENDCDVSASEHPPFEVD